MYKVDPRVPEKTMVVPPARIVAPIQWEVDEEMRREQSSLAPWHPGTSQILTVDDWFKLAETLWSTAHTSL
ncbi:hypothetical protein UPYG_G00321680 [Umbra pygmaea]|uniref:Uncharacterized protein n=1 Tax=Umbra pygmaea TaxID=75934 RepID=A0ABD0W587_UMBPY